MLNRPAPSSLLLLLILAMLLGLSALPLAAATTTAPIGYTEHRIAGTGGQIYRARTYLAAPMLGRAVETRTIARIDGATLHLQLSEPSEKSLQASPLPRSTYAGTHYLQIVKGPRTGYHADLADGDAGSIQTTHDLSALLQPGDAYQVRPYTTLTALLGPNNRYARLHAAATFAEADQIYIPDPGSGQLAAYYYRQQADAAPGLAHRDGRPVQTDPILYPGSGFMISRIAKADTTLVTTGSVQTHAAVIPVETGINFIASSFPVDTTLAEFFGPNRSDFSEDDFVILPSKYGGQDQYRLTPTQNGPQWQPHGEAPPADQAKISSGSVVILHRQGKAFNLRLERPFKL